VLWWRRHLYLLLSSLDNLRRRGITVTRCILPMSTPQASLSPSGSTQPQPHTLKDPATKTMMIVIPIVFALILTPWAFLGIWRLIRRRRSTRIHDDPPLTRCPEKQKQQREPQLLDVWSPFKPRRGSSTNFHVSRLRCC
jgi:hypothetical protein